jgi:lyso-ornithine lipid O-acyltransferase
MIAAIRIALVTAAFVVLSLALIPVQYLFIRTGWPAQRKLPVFFHRIVCRLLGLKLHVHGNVASDRPLLLVANHTSWLDIMVLSAVAEVSFIAKSEVRKWPIFGTFAVLQRSVFIERERRGKTGEQASEIARRLNEGDVMVLFAEGTTGDGNRVLPFKTSLFGAAQMAVVESKVGSVTVQPVAVAYTRAHGLPLGRYHRPIASWPGHVKLVPHLKGVLKEGAFDVDVRFGAPVPFAEGGDRKALARSMEAEVRRMLSEALHGERGAAA